MPAGTVPTGTVLVGTVLPETGPVTVGPVEPPLPPLFPFPFPDAMHGLLCVGTWPDLHCGTLPTVTENPVELPPAGTNGLLAVGACPVAHG